MRLFLLTFFFCLLALQGTLQGQDGPKEDPGRLISLLASKDRTVPKRTILERLRENREAHLPEIRKAAREAAHEKLGREHTLTLKI